MSVARDGVVDVASMRDCKEGNSKGIQILKTEFFFGMTEVDVSDSSLHEKHQKILTNDLVTSFHNPERSGSLLDHYACYSDMTW